MLRLVRPVGLIVVAAVVGFVLARTLERPARPSGALTRAASTRLLAVHYPGDWDPVRAPPLRGLSLGDQLAIGPRASAGERMVIGTARATSLGTLPAAFLASLPHPPTPQIVALGPYRFDRYLDLRPRGAGAVVSVYLLATTRATVIATCSSPRPDATFTAGCERVLRTLRLARGVKIAENVDAAYALELNQVLATLNEARLANARDLRIRDLATRAHAARRLAGAESRAARTARRLPAGIAVAANDTLVSALREAADGYAALGRAALAHDPSAYERAQHTLTLAQRRLAGAFKALAELGYRLQ
ncbi:MAG TPA: hypothetical protein VFN36_06720 [Solirubrobacteraceae bacterium]|nr:hypothetical protein [Solirubrobacteraceae bacterium]